MSVVLILGATSDIAQALAKQYAHNGYDIYLAARDTDNLTAFASDLAIREGVIVDVFEVDILNFESHAAFYQQFNEKPMGAICCIGYLGVQNKAELSFSESEKIIGSNYTGIVSLLNIIAGDFEARGVGFIVGIASVAGLRGRKSNYIYGSAKAALISYLSGLRNRLHNTDVHVMTVNPGFVNTKMTLNLELPALLTAEPIVVAKDIFNAQKKKRDVIYTLWRWRWIMLLIRLIPESVFKRLNL